MMTRMMRMMMMPPLLELSCKKFYGIKNVLSKEKVYQILEIDIRQILNARHQILREVLLLPLARTSCWNWVEFFVSLIVRLNSTTCWNWSLEKISENTDQVLESAKVEPFEKDLQKDDDFAPKHTHTTQTRIFIENLPDCPDLLTIVRKVLKKEAIRSGLRSLSNMGEPSASTESFMSLEAWMKETLSDFFCSPLRNKRAKKHFSSGERVRGGSCWNSAQPKKNCPNWSFGMGVNGCNDEDNEEKADEEVE